MDRQSATWLTRLIIILVLVSASKSDAQQEADTSGLRIKEVALISVNGADASAEEWRLALKSGNVIQCNRSDISLVEDELLIKGSRMQVTVPREEVTSLLIKIPNAFRNGALLGALIGAAIFLSPEQTPGFYFGSVEDQGGVGGTGIVLAIGTAGLIGGLASSIELPSRTVELKGTESVAAWKSLLEGEVGGLHIRGALGFVRENGGGDWKNYYEGLGGTKTNSNYYYYNTYNEDDLSSFNLFRFFSVTYTVAKKLEAGAGIHTGGVPSFFREYPHYTSGNPPQKIFIDLPGEYSTMGYYALLNYLPFGARPRAFSLRLGAGLGLGALKINNKARGYSFYTNIGSSPSVDETSTRFAGIISAGLDYYFDASLSIGIYGDYSLFGSYTLPAQTFFDSSSKPVLTIPGTSLNLDSMSGGITIGIHY